MRILNIAFALSMVGDAAVGGAEQILSHLDKALVAAGHQSLVVAAASSKVQGSLFGTSPMPALITGDYYRFRYLEHSRKIEEALSQGPDLIHMHGVDFWEFVPKTKIPLLATLHLPPQWYPNWIFYVQRPNFFLNCVSDSQHRTVPESKLIAQTIGNGVEIPQVEPVSKSRRKGAVLIGRICAEKGIHIGISAAQAAKVPLSIAGPVFGYSEHLKYFEEQVASALNNEITYHGPVGPGEKAGLLRSAKCILIPSQVPETSSLIAMEALACGTPVVAMRSGALPEIVENGKTGFVVDSIEGMTEAILHVDQLDPAICRATAAKRFSAARMAREYMRLYERLINQNRKIETQQGSAIADTFHQRVA